MTYTVTISHIDTCHADALQDHHNRDGEMLVGVPVDGDTTIGDVLDEVFNEWKERSPDLDRPTDLDVAVTAALGAFGNECGDLRRRFAPDLEPVEEWGNEEHPSAWFLITWTDDADADAPTA